MSASHCDECRNGKLFWYSYRGGEPFDVMKCEKGHKPRFYRQRHDDPMDTNYGWKRTCSDFQWRWILTPNDRVEGRDAASSRRVPSHDGLCGNGNEGQKNEL